jgi:polyisoprenoid-binding protein YceI
MRSHPSGVGSAALLAVLLLLACSVAEAAPHDYRIDPVHSRIVFTIDHLGLSSAIGTLSAPRGWLRFDHRDWSSAAVEVEIALERLDFGDVDWNARSLKRDFLDVAGHPVAVFRSTRVEPIDDQHARVHGDLSLRGVTRPVALEVRFNRATRHPLTLRRTVGFSAVASIERSAFGITAWSRLVGDRVELRIELEAIRSRRAASDDRNDDPGDDDNNDDDDDPAQQ